MTRPIAGLPGLWLACASAFLPAVEFLVRAQLGDRLAGSVVSALWFAGTLAVLLASGAPVRGHRAAGWMAALAAVPAVSGMVRGIPAAFPSITLLCAGLAAFLLAGSTGVRASRLAGGLLAGGALASAFALWQRFGGLASLAPAAAAQFAETPTLAANMRERISEGRAFAFFLYPNALGAFLAMGIPSALERWREARGTGMPFLGWGMLVLLLVSGLFSTGSIGSVLALALALGATAYLRRGKAGRHARDLAVGALILLAAVVVSRPYSAVPGALQNKAAHWRDAITSWRGPAALALGTGPGSYGDAVGSRLPGEYRSRHAHNWLVETFVENGVAGLAALTGLLIVLLAAFGRVVREGAGWGLWAGWLAVLFHMMGDIDYALPSIILPWLAISGALAVAACGVGTHGKIPLPSIWTAVPPLLAVVLVPLFGGARAGLVLSSCLALAAFGILVDSLASGNFRDWTGRKDLPFWGLLGFGILWIGLSPGPAQTYPVILEGVGLFALMLAARRALERIGWAAGALRWTIMGLAAIHGAWAVGEGLATGGPAFTTFPSPNFLAAFLVAGFGMAAWSALSMDGGERRWAIAASLAALGGIAASRSSGAALATGMLVVVLLVTRGFRPGAARFRWCSAAAAVFLAAGIIGIPPINPISLAQRITIWKEGALALRERPLGWGPGRYAAASSRVRLPSYTSAGIARYSLRADFAHCEPLQAAVEWGLPGLGLFAWLGWTLFAVARRRPSPWAFGLLGITIHSLVDFPFRAPPLEAASAVMIGGLTIRRWERNPGPRGKGGLSWAVVAFVAAWASLSLVRPAVARILADSPEGWSRKADILALYPLDLRGMKMDIRVARARGGEADWERVVDLDGLANCITLSDGSVDVSREMAAVTGRTGQRLAGSTRPEDVFGMAIRREMAPGGNPEKAAEYLSHIGRDSAALPWIRMAQAREPFNLRLYVWEAAIIGGQAGRRIERKAELLRGLLLKRKGFNDYERRIVGAGADD